MFVTLGSCCALGNQCTDMCACAGVTASCHVQLAPTTPWRWRLMDPCSLGVAASMVSWAIHPFMLSTSWCLTSLSCSQHPTRLPRWSQATCSHGGASRPLQLVGSLLSNQPTWSASSASTIVARHACSVCALTTACNMLTLLSLLGIAGSHHSAAITVSGALLMFGRNKHGQVCSCTYDYKRADMFAVLRAHQHCLFKTAVGHW